jgi:4-hydroxybenzoate polyprenyltransferase
MTEQHDDYIIDQRNQLREFDRRLKGQEDDVGRLATSRTGDQRIAIICSILCVVYVILIIASFFTHIGWMIAVPSLLFIPTLLIGAIADGYDDHGW